MAQLGNAFDSGQYDDMANFEPIPAGEYVVHVTDSDILVTKAKDGKYIKLEFTVLKGEFKGRKIWTNLNIENPNAVAVEIAQKELATLCRACGKAVIQDTQQLHAIPIKMKVKVTPAKGDFPAKNAPTGYAPLTGGPSGPVPGSNPSEPEGSFEDPEDVEEDAPWEDDSGSDPDDDIPY